MGRFCVVERDLARYQRKVDDDAAREIFIEQCIEEGMAPEEAEAEADRREAAERQYQQCSCRFHGGCECGLF